MAESPLAHHGSNRFDPVAVGEKIAGHIKQADSLREQSIEHSVAADKLKEQSIEHSVAAGKMLVDVAQNHKTHLDAICNRIGLGRSRRAELMQIAGGRKTVEQVQRETRDRVQRHRDMKRLLKPPPEPEPKPPPMPSKPCASVTGGAVTDKTDNLSPEQTAELRKAEMARLDVDEPPAKPIADGKPSPTPTVKQRLAEMIATARKADQKAFGRVNSARVIAAVKSNLTISELATILAGDDPTWIGGWKKMAEDQLWSDPKLNGAGHNELLEFARLLAAWDGAGDRARARFLAHVGDKTGKAAA